MGWNFPFSFWDKNSLFIFGINIALDKQTLTVPYQFVTVDLNSERDTYTFGLEQKFLREKKKNANLLNRIKFPQNKINELEWNQN